MTARLVRIFMLLLAISASSFGLTSSASASHTIAKLPPGVTSDSPFTLGAYSYIQRTSETSQRKARKVLIQRIGPRGSLKTVAKRTTGRSSFSVVKWFGYGHLVAALGTDLDGGEMGDPWVYAAVLYGTVAGNARMQVLDRCPTGPVVAHSGFIAEISNCDGTGKSRLNIFRAQGGRLKRTSSTLLPVQAQPQIHSIFPSYRPDTAIDVDGERAVIAWPGRAISFNWKSGTTQLIRAIADENVKFISLNHDGGFTLVSRDELKYESDLGASGGTLVWRYDGTSTDPTWFKSLGQITFDRIIGQGLYFVPQDSIPGDDTLGIVDKYSGSVKRFGSVPQTGGVYSPNSTVVSQHMTAGSVVWVQTTCFFDLIRQKRLDETVTIDHPDCPVALVRGSAHLKRFRLSVTVNSPRGFRASTVSGSWGRSFIASDVSAAAPGIQRIDFKVGGRQAKFLRSHPKTLITFRIARWNTDDIVFRARLNY